MKNSNLKFLKEGLKGNLIDNSDNKKISIPLGPNPQIPYYVNITQSGANVYHFKGDTLLKLKAEYKNKKLWEHIPETNYHSEKAKNDSGRKQLFIAKANAYGEFHFHPKIKKKLQSKFKKFENYWKESTRYKNWSSNDNQDLTLSDFNSIDAGTKIFESNQKIEGEDITGELPRKLFWFGKKKFGEQILESGEKVEKTPYGYNFIKADGWKKAYAEDMVTKLFDGDLFSDIEKASYGYNLIDKNGYKTAYDENKKNQLFNGCSFLNITKTDYGYNLIQKYNKKIALKKDMETFLFNGEYFLSIEKNNYGYIINDPDGLKYAFRKDMETELFDGNNFKSFKKTKFGFELLLENNKKLAFKDDMITKLFGGCEYEVVQKNGKKIIKGYKYEWGEEFGEEEEVEIFMKNIYYDPETFLEIV